MHPEIESLRKRTADLEYGQFQEALNVLRDAHAFARIHFGEEHIHVRELAWIEFRPKGMICSEGSYQNADAWNHGIKSMTNTLNAMAYEWKLLQSKKVDLAPPAKVTIPWLFRYLSWSVWISFFACLGLAWGLGFAMGKNDFFRQLRDLITNTSNP
jgi:hypothetical protein